MHQTVDDWRPNSLTFSPDSRSLATSEVRGGIVSPAEYRVRILDADTYVERCRYNGNLGNMAQSLSFSHDGGWVLGMDTAMAFVFDATSGTERWRQPFHGISSLALSPDSGSVAIGCLQDGVAVLDARTGAERRRVTTPSEVWSVAYSPDNRWIVAGCSDVMVGVFDAGTGTQAWSVPLIADKDGSVESVAVSDDAQWVAAISTRGILGVYDLPRGTPRFPPVKLSPFGKVLYSSTLRHVVVNVSWPGQYGLTVIDARTGLEDGSSSSSSSEISKFAIGPDGGSIAASGAGFVDLYDLDVEISRYAVDATLTSIEMSPAGTPLVAVADTSPAGTAVTVVVAASGARLARKPIPGTVASIVFADGGQAVAAGGSNGVRLFSTVSDRSWKVDTIGPVNALAAAGLAGEWIATAAGKTVRLLSSADGHSRWTSPNTHPQTVTRIASSRDGKWIATGCADRKTRIIDALTGTETFSVEGDGKVHAVAFQPNESLLATGNEDGTVVLIDAATASVRGRVTRLIACSQIAFSFDATMLAVAWDDNTISIFDITTSSSPQQLQQLTCPGPISALAFNPADNSVAVATAAESIVVHDARSGIELVRILQPHPIRQFAFSADGAVIATISDDGIVRVWASGSPPRDQ